jgi:hypothetical protein
LPKITILRWFFPSKCYNFSKDWDRVKCFSALVTRYLMIDLWSFLPSHKSKIFLAMRGTAVPFKPQTEGDTSPFCQPPDLFVGDHAEKVVTFLNIISRTKKVLRA